MKCATVFSPQLLRTGTPTAPGYIELTADEAYAAAEEDGLTLLRSADSATGFKGVVKAKGARPFQAMICRNGTCAYLGSFATPEQAALIYARQPEARAAAKPASMSADEALAAADEEGLTLPRSETTNSGFKGVSKLPNRSLPFCAKVRREGAKVHLGSFATAEEAALVYARQPEARAAAKPASAPAAEPSMSADEALAAADEEGLTLPRSEKNTSGFKGVNKNLDVYLGHVYLGRFATAEEAALTLARRRKRAEARQPDDERDECPICLDTLSSVADVVTTKCGHVFCRACLLTHFGDDGTADCPSCRHKLIKGEERSVERPEAPPPERKRSKVWSLAERKNMPSLIMKRTRAADSSQAGPSSAPPKVYRFSAAEIGQDAGRLPRRPRSCQRLGLPDWRPPPADPEQSA